tara:strand:- start:61677 stop:63443 length:1767 start_codon:yes stop_codon:yes gene_type:complete
MKSIIQYFKEILYLIGEKRKKLPLLVFFFLSSSLLDIAGLGLIGPYISLIMNPDILIQSSIGTFLSGFGLSMESNDLIISMGTTLVLIFILKTVSNVFIQMAVLRFSWNRQITLRTYLMHSYQTMPYSHYIQRNSSDYIQTIQVLVSNFQKVLQSLLRLMSEGIVVLIIIIFLGTTNLSALALLLALLFGTLLTYDRFFRKNVEKYGEQVSKSGRKLVQGIHEGIEGFKELRILRMNNYFKQMVYEGSKEQAENQIKVSLISNTPRYLIELVLIFFVVIFAVGTLLITGNNENIFGTLGMFGVASIRLMPMANLLIVSITQLRFGRYAISKLYEDCNIIDDLKSESYNSSGKENIEKFNSLTLEGVSYKYPNSKNLAIDNLSLSINAGESIGFIGESGSGKTTLIDLLLGLLVPARGKIYFNGKSFIDSLNSWHSQTAYMPQEIFIIDNSLSQNVAIGVEKENIDYNKVNLALEKARLKELVKELPLGIETELGERGIRLSGGQRQRVALARAFYHERNILVMDEATSSLDYQTEKEIVKEIKDLKGKKTLIVIAHRLSTVKHCDRIYKLRKGCLIQEGTYQEVVQKN